MSRHDGWNRTAFHYISYNADDEISQTQRQGSISLGLTTLSKAGNDPRVFGPSGPRNRVEKHQSEIPTANTAEWFITTTVDLCDTRFKNVCILFFLYPLVPCNYQWPWRNYYFPHTEPVHGAWRISSWNLVHEIIFPNTFEGRIQGVSILVLTPKFRAWCNVPYPLMSSNSQNRWEQDVYLILPGPYSYFHDSEERP